MISRLVKSVDGALFALAKRRARNRDDAAFDALAMNVREVHLGQIQFGFLTAVDAKSAALLTHISIMIAFSIILFEAAKSNVLVRYLVGAEAIAYILLACLSLRCIRTFAPDTMIKTPDDYRRRLGDEVIYRRELYELTLNLVSIVTVLFAMTFALNLFLSFK